MNDRKQSSTTYPITFFLNSSTDKTTGVVGITPTVTLSKNGGAFAAAAGAVTEIGVGWYSLAGNATDRNTIGELILHATGTGADPAERRLTIVPWDPFDANLALTNLDATVSSRSTYAGADTAGTTTLLGRLTGQRSTNLDNLDATVSSRLATAGYTAPPTAAAIVTAAWQDATAGDFTVTGSIGKRIMDNVDATISSRSTYAGGDTAGTTTLLARLTDARSTNLDNLDATVSSRSTYAGGTVAGVTDKAGFSLSATGLGAVVIETGGTPASIDLAQAIQLILSVACGALTGADTGSIAIKGASVSATRVTATGDSYGNRSAVVLTPSSI